MTMSMKRQFQRSKIIYLLVALPFLGGGQGLSARRSLKIHIESDNAIDHRADQSGDPRSSDSDGLDEAAPFPVENDRRGEQQVENDRVSVSGVEDDRGRLEGGAQAHDEDEGEDENSRKRKLAAMSEAVHAGAWRSLPLPDKQEMLHKLSQRIATRHKVATEIIQQSKRTVEEEKYTLIAREGKSSAEGVSTSVIQQMGEHVEMNTKLRFVSQGKSCDLGEAEGMWVEAMLPQYPRPANANFFSSWIPFEESCRLRPWLATFLNVSGLENSDLYSGAGEESSNSPAKGAQYSSLKAGNTLNEAVYNDDPYEDLSIDMLDLDPTDEFDTAIKLFSLDESFRKDFKEHTSKTALLSNSMSGLAPGHETDRDPFECPGFLKQKRILMIGDSIDRRVLESFCDLSSHVAQHIGSRRKIRLEAVLEGEATPESKALPAAPVCCRGMEDCVLICQMWIGGVSPIGPYHVQDFYDGLGTLNATTAYRVQNLLPRLGDWMATQTNDSSGSLALDYVSVHSLFWDWARVNDHLAGGPGTNRKTFYKELHPEHEFLVNWAADAKTLIGGVKKYVQSRDPSRTKVVWPTSPVPKELGYDSRKYVIPLNALARSIARKKGLQILDFEKIVDSLQLTEWSMADRKHPDTGLSLEIFNLILNIMLQD